MGLKPRLKLEREWVQGLYTTLCTDAIRLFEQDEYTCQRDPSLCKKLYCEGRDAWDMLRTFIANLAHEVLQIIASSGWSDDLIERSKARLREIIKRDICTMVDRAYCMNRDNCIATARYLFGHSGNYFSQDEWRWVCSCLEGHMKPLHNLIDSYFAAIKSRIARRQQQRQQQQLQSDVRKFFVELAIAAVVALVGASLAVLATAGGARVAAEVMSIIVARFGQQRHPDLEEMVRPWVEAKAMSLPTIGEVAAGTPELEQGLPMSRLRIGALAEGNLPMEVAQQVFDEHISDLQRWAADYVEEQAQIIGEA